MKRWCCSSDPSSSPQDLNLDAELESDCMRGILPTSERPDITTPLDRGGDGGAHTLDDFTKCPLPTRSGHEV
eukprot:606678-Amphidinium_carterae.1